MIKKHEEPKSRVVCPICFEPYTNTHEVAVCMIVRHGVPFDKAMQRLTNVGLLHPWEADHIKTEVEERSHK